MCTAVRGLWGVEPIVSHQVCAALWSAGEPEEYQIDDGPRRTRQAQGAIVATQRMRVLPYPSACTRVQVSSFMREEYLQVSSFKFQVSM